MLISNLDAIAQAGNDALPEVASVLGLTLKRHSRAQVSTKEHNSLVISTQGKGFVWNSQGVKGNCFALVQAYTGCNFREAVETVASACNIALEFGDKEPKAKRTRKRLSSAEFSHAKPKVKEAPNKAPNPEKSTSKAQIQGLVHNAYLQTKNRAYTCTFTRWVISHFGEQGKQALAKYKVTSAANGFTCFWRLDYEGRAHRGELLRYVAKPQSVNRAKEGYTNDTAQAMIARQKGIAYDASELKNPVFGEHLLKDYAGQNVAIVEAPKTAILATILAPKINNKPVLWLAVGGSSLNPLKRLKIALQGKTTLLFPDEGQAQNWATQAKELASDLHLELVSPQTQNLKEKEDFADVLLRQFFKAKAKEQNQSESLGMALDSLEERAYDLPNLHQLYAPTLPLPDFVEVLREWLKVTGYCGVVTPKFLVFRRSTGY